MPQTGIMPTEQKIKIVKEYIDGVCGPTEINERYGVTKHRLYEWVRKYRVSGEAGLVSSTTNKEYSPELKMKAVIDYLSSATSIRTICSKYEINDGATLRRWIAWYNVHGDFKQPNSGGAKHMAKTAKSRDTTLDERIEIVSYFIASNMDYAKTIEQYGVSYHQIYRWNEKYKQYGAEGLADRRGKRKDESSMSEIEKLQAQIKLKEAENLRLQMENDLLKKLGEIERRRGRN